MKWRTVLVANRSVVPHHLIKLKCPLRVIILELRGLVPENYMVMLSILIHINCSPLT